MSEAAKQLGPEDAELFQKLLDTVDGLELIEEFESVILSKK